ncbi:MAG: IclR family transcriptional regulator [Candidatus Bathyarchaeia archaeon]
MATPRVNQSVVKALKILDLLQDAHSLSAHEISKTLALPVGTVYSILYALEQRGYVQRHNSTTGFTLGYQFLLKTHNILAKIEHLQIAKPFLYELAKKHNVNVHYAILYQWKVLYLQREMGRMPPIVSEVLGLTELPYCTAIGKALLSGLDPIEWNLYIQQEKFIKSTPHTITDPVQLAEEIQQVRKQGFALSCEEAHIGVVGIGAPLHDFQGNVVAAISISVDKYRYERERETLVGAVINTAGAIERQYGAIKPGTERR